MKVRFINYTENYFEVLDRLRQLPYFILFDTVSSGSRLVASALPSTWVNFDNTQTKGSISKLKGDLRYGDNSVLAYEDLAKLIEAGIRENTGENFQTGWAGYFSYESGYKENFLQKESVNYPFLCLGFYDWSIHIEAELQQITLYFDDHCSQNFIDYICRTLDSNVSNTCSFQLQQEFISETPKNKYLSDIEKTKRYLNSGDCYQINYTHSFKSLYSGDPWVAYKQLRTHSPAPYSGFFDTDSLIISSHSPEMFLDIKNLKVTTKPIKGTRPRGASPETDQQAAQELLNSEKDRSENLMIVDLLRNDLNKTAKTGTVSVTKIFGLESFANVHHLVSTVIAELPEGQSPFATFIASFPGGSITGAPKRRAMEIIAELESAERGPYCGSLFYYGSNGAFNSNIMIRTLAYQSGIVRVWGGGGIVMDSIPDDEYQESITKIKNLIELLEQQFLKR